MCPRRFAPLAAFVLSTLLIAAASLYSEPKSSSEPAPETNDKQFHKQLLAAAQTYIKFGRVDDQRRWAPELCNEPQPGQAHFSRSSDEGTHGQKIYSLFAKDRNAYVAAPTKPAPEGQILVKQSWIPEEVKDAKTVPPRTDRSDFNPYVQRDGKVYKASKLAGLFIMMKLDPKTAGTDDGWVYGTVSADGETITSAGRVESCMKCHETKKDRQFGLRQAEKTSGEKP